MSKAKKRRQWGRAVYWRAIHAARSRSDFVIGDLGPVAIPPSSPIAHAFHDACVYTVRNLEAKLRGEVSWSDAQ